MVTVLPYLRQSEAKTGENAEDSLSLNAQLAAIEGRAAKETWVLLPAIRDHDVRGSDPNRPGIAELWKRVQSEKPDAIAVFAMSRFARDYAWQELTWRQLRAHGVKVVSMTEPNIDHTLMRGMLGVVGQYQSEQIGQFLVASFERRAASGLYHGVAPYGYLKRAPPDDPRGQPVLIPHPNEGPIVQRVYALSLEDLRFIQIADLLNREGLPPRKASNWSGNMIRLILRNPVYMGDVRYKGKIVATDAHEPLVSREEWHEAQCILNGKSVVKTKKWDTNGHWLEGLVRHACGRRMYRVETWGPRSKTASISFACESAYFPKNRRCPIKRRSVSVTKLESAVRDCLALDLGNILSLEGAIAAAERSAGGSYVERERESLLKQREALVARRDRAEHLYTSGRRDLAWFDQEDAEIKPAILVIDEQFAALPQWPQVDHYAVAREQMTSWARVIADAPGADIAAVLREVGDVVVGEVTVSIAYHQPYSDFIVPASILVGRWGS